MDMQSWQEKMKLLGLPYKSTAYFVFLNICPACKNVATVKCVHCNNERTYDSFRAISEKREATMFRDAVRRALELQKEIEVEKNKLKDIEGQLKEQGNILNKLVADVLIELSRLEEVLSRIPSAKKYTTFIGKIKLILQQKDKEKTQLLKEK